MASEEGAMEVERGGASEEEQETALQVRGNKRRAAFAASGDGKQGARQRQRISKEAPTSVRGGGGNKKQRASSASAAAAVAAAADDEEEGGEKDDEKSQAAASDNAEEGRHTNAGQKGGNEEQDDDDDDDDDDGMEEEKEDEEVTRGLGPEARVKRPQQINRPGAPPETGIIVKIYCENFMCHRKLSINLNRNVNFINGQNGSGKSAILAALQICLGARAGVTHRGSRLSDLIRQGHDGNAIVRVTLLNRGPDAYQPERYGEYITVERKIQRSGSAEYRLLCGDPNKQDDLKYISKSKDDLKVMLDRFNIQVENPCALLDQENAKKFIQGDPGEKYDFFIQATDLARIADSLSDSLRNVKGAQAKLEIEQEQLPALREIWKEYRKKLESMEGLTKIEKEIKEMKVKLVWAHHEVNKASTRGLEKEVSKAEKAVEKLKKEMDVIDQQKKEKEESMGGIEENIKAINEKIRDAKETMKELKQKIAEKKGPCKKIEENIRAKTEEIKSYLKRKKGVEANLKEERARVAALNADEVGAMVQHLEEIQGQLNQILQQKERAEREMVELRREREEVAEALPGVTARLKGMDADLTRMRQERESLDTRNQVSVFGRDFVLVMKEIEKRKDWRQVPIGPLGLHVKIKDGYQEWKGPIENAIGMAMEQFLVTNSEDRMKLLHILKKYNNTSRQGILTVKPNQGRYVPRAAPQGILTVTECINVEDTLVWNALIDHARIDQSAIFRTRQDAEASIGLNHQGVEDLPQNIKTAYWLEDYMLTVTHGARLFRPVAGPGGRCRRLGVDTAEIAANLERDLQEVGHQRAELKKEQNELDSRARRLREQDRKLKSQLKEIGDKEAGLRNDERQLDQEIHETREGQTGVDLSDLTRDIENFDQQIRIAQETVATLEQEKVKYQEELDPLLGEEANEKRRNDKLRKECEHEMNKLESVEKEVNEMDNRKNKAERALKKQQDIYESKKRDHAQASAADANDLEQAINYTRTILGDAWNGEEIEPAETVDQLKRDIQRKTHALNKSREQQNVNESVDVVREKCEKAKYAFQDKKNKIEKLAHLNEKFFKGIEARKRRSRAYRKGIIRAATIGFDDVLQHKGQSGGLYFDHKDKTLNLTVQKDNRDDSTQSKNVKELSGGERSFTTLALLIALGESVECPFRVMDEFDIFMDAVSRKVALELLLSTAISERMEHRQFIFITPQDLGAVQPTTKVKIHKMRPPERNVGGLQQTTL